jgi:hypothetical protein
MPTPASEPMGGIPSHFGNRVMARYLKARIEKHPLSRPCMWAGIPTSFVSARCHHSATCTIVWMPDCDRAIWTAGCECCIDVITGILPPIDTFLQRHWVYKHTRVTSERGNHCMLAKTLVVPANAVTAGYICTECSRAHRAESNCLASKWLLARALFGRDLGGVIMTVSLSFFARNLAIYKK